MQNRTYLASKLARGADDEEAGRSPSLVRARLVVVGKARKVLDDRQPEGDGLACSGARLSDYVAPRQDVFVRDSLR